VAVSEAEHEHGDEHQATPLELFFDLVFVFAITQVTRLLANEPTWGEVFRERCWSSRPSGGRGASTRG
jgi:low temperature requirement protein LtrA